MLSLFQEYESFQALTTFIPIQIILITLPGWYTTYNSQGIAYVKAMIGNQDISFMANYQTNWDRDASHLLPNCVKCLQLINQVTSTFAANGYLWLDE